MTILKNIFFTLFIALFASCQNKEDLNQNPRILVSISPYNVFIEKLTEGFAEVNTIVPKGHNPHFFTPTIKQISQFDKAVIYFRIGENFESKILPSLLDKNPNMAVIDLRKTISLIPIEEIDHGDHVHGSMDIHLWLSPKVIIKQLISIQKALIDAFPEKQSLIEKRVKTLQNELLDLNEKIKNLSLKGVYFLSSHAAFAYYCRDYQCFEVPLEMGQKEPTAKYLEELIVSAKKNKIRHMVIIPQINDKGAKILASKLGIDTYIFDPYKANYFENLYSFSKYIKGNP